MHTNTNLDTSSKIDQSHAYCRHYANRQASEVLLPDAISSGVIYEKHGLTSTMIGLLGSDLDVTQVISAWLNYFKRLF